MTALLRGAKTLLPAQVERWTQALVEIRNRLHGTESSDLASKRAVKPNLQNVGSWFEGRLTKFIAGEDGEVAKPGELKKGEEKPGQTSAPVGPFSHYSSIAPDAASPALARATSSFDLGNRYAEAPAIARSGSAMAYRQVPPTLPVPRPSSAMSYRASSGYMPPLPATDSERRLSSERVEDPSPFDQDSSRRGSSRGTSDYGQEIQPSTNIAIPAVASLHQNEVSVPSWGQSYDFNDSNQPDDTPSSSFATPEGFVTPMQTMVPTFGGTPVSHTPSGLRRVSTFDEEEEDDDDLGLGNSSSKAKAKPVSAAVPLKGEDDTANAKEDPYKPKMEEKKAEAVEEKKGLFHSVPCLQCCYG